MCSSDLGGFRFLPIRLDDHVPEMLGAHSRIHPDRFAGMMDREARDGIAHGRSHYAALARFSLVGHQNHVIARGDVFEAAIFDAAVGGPLCLIDVATASRCYGAHEETKGVSTALFEVSLSLSVSTIRLHGRAERLKKSAGPLGSPCGT